MNETLTIELIHGITVKASPQFQYNYGQVLKFSGVTLPDEYEVQFANAKSGDSIRLFGSADGVVIPWELYETGAPIYVWVYAHYGEDDGITVYEAVIPVNRRAKPTDIEPTPKE